MNPLLIDDCRLLDADSNTSPASLLIENGKIARIEKPGVLPDVKSKIQAEGRILCPGFIDVHIQGAGGADILDSTEQALRTIAQTNARFGTTAYLATTVFKPGQPNHHLAVAAEHVGRDLGGAALLGIHLEGPFISPKKRGMIQPDCICLPDLDALKTIYDLCSGHLRMMTIAPELPECTPVIQSLVQQHCIASLGHTSSSYEQTLQGFQAGIDHVTHLFNAMPSLHHRQPSPLAAIFENQAITVQVIPDGVHIHPSVLRMAFNALGPERFIAITDGMQALGLPDGMHEYNGIPYESSNGAARYKDGTLIGTALGLDGLIKRLMRFTDCPLATAVKTVTENPARLLGLAHRKGAIQIGLDADLVLLNDDLSVHHTLVGGKTVFSQ
jgi:N-acetylglucosamine-6-phosphate deacetylase